MSIHPAVTDDVAEIVSYIAADDPVAAESVSNAIYDQFSVLQAHPGLGVPFRTGVAKLAGIRMIPVPRYRNYLIFYTPIEGGIRILYVFHGAQDVSEQMAEDMRD